MLFVVGFCFLLKEWLFDALCFSQLLVVQIILNATYTAGKLIRMGSGKLIRMGSVLIGNMQFMRWWHCEWLFFIQVPKELLDGSITIWIDRHGKVHMEKIGLPHHFLFFPNCWFQGWRCGCILDDIADIVVPKILFKSFLSILFWQVMHSNRQI